MKRILVTHSYFIKFDPKQVKAGNAYPPLGTLILASCLKNMGVNVSFHDTMFSENAADIGAAIEAFNPEILIICDDAFNYLTKMCLSNMREAAFEMIKIAKKHHLKVIVNSSDASDHYGLYLDKGADYVVLGEAEPSIVELVELLSNSVSFEKLSLINNLVYRKDATVVKNPKREVLKDLDSLPMAAWDLVDINRYKEFRKKHHVPFSINLVTTRGCPYKCNWCAKPIYGNRYNSRTPSKVVEEIKYLVDKFEVEHIWFADDIFGLRPEWIKELAVLIQESGLKFKFKIQSRADLIAEESTVQALSSAGCDEVWLGAESGSQKILDAMDKGVTVSQIQKSRYLLKKYGIKAAFFLQFGYLGEVKSDIEDTIHMVLNLMPDDIGISVSYPLPGTKFYDKVKSDLNTKTNWTDSDELAMMFENTYPPQYYRYLQKYVHSVYRKAKTKAELINGFNESRKLNGNLLRKVISVPYNKLVAGYYGYKMSSNLKLKK